MTTAMSDPVPSASRHGMIARWTTDHANPILVRVVRQHLRSRTFIGVFSLLLVGALLTAMLVATLADAGGAGAAQGFFGLIAFAWAFAMWVAQPLGCFRAIAVERNEDTWDLLELTGLRPRQVLTGLMQAALVQGMLYTSALAPFMVMGYLLRGIEIVHVLFTLIVIPAGGIAGCALAVFASCLGTNKASRAVIGGVLGLALVGVWLMSAGLWFNLGNLGYVLGSIITAPTADVIAGLIGIANLWLAAVATLLLLAGTLLTFRAANRSTGPRLLWWILLGNLFTWAMIWPAVDPGDTIGHLFALMSPIAVMFSAVLGLFAVSEDYELSPRQARWLATAPRWRRPFDLILGPGAARGRLCWFAMVTVSLGAGMPGSYQSSTALASMQVATTCAAYTAIHFVIGDWLYRRWFRRWFPTPPLRRAFLLVLLAVTALLPLFGMLADTPISHAMAFLSMPYGITRFASDFDDSTTAFAIVLIGGGLALVWQLVEGISHRHVSTARVFANGGDRNPRGG